MKLLNVKFKVFPASVDETRLSKETPQKMVERLSLIKAKAVSSQHREAWTIGADTVVALGDEIFGKPVDGEEAKEMLRKLQGKSHEVWGGIALLNQEKGFEGVKSFKTEVFMSSMTDRDIEEYVDSGEPLDKAGAYAIQGIGAKYVLRISGSYTNVVGLDIASLRLMMKDVFLCE